MNKGSGLESGQLAFNPINFFLNRSILHHPRRKPLATIRNCGTAQDLAKKIARRAFPQAVMWQKAHGYSMRSGLAIQQTYTPDCPKSRPDPATHTPLLRARARCVNGARRDLCGGCGATRIPTATVITRAVSGSTATTCSVPHSASKFFSIFIANGSLISVCRGTASTTPVFGLIQSECEVPSRFR
jgi:hypothetical protein